ncbi:hypothetical protein GA830_06820 [Mesorhizobium sp. NBSH29]|uniref:SlyX family protein n=1 Tax=Mesorhizobium sp. NBSH29 TaxID=2654249 RepID=UPI0018969121|nr:SlyX family protein [Mesorhizobium sp. NBSH29]QPC86478.1 hypothetical protein GA830_06820 [Mesorhizobium sp. NBSH29]
MTISEDRLVALEMRVAEQDHTIEELSSEIAEQWKRMERMQKTVSVLAERFAALEEASTPSHEAAKPPHW